MGDQLYLKKIEIMIALGFVKIWREQVLYTSNSDTMLSLWSFKVTKKQSCSCNKQKQEHLYFIQHNCISHFISMFYKLFSSSPTKSELNYDKRLTVGHKLFKNFIICFACRILTADYGPSLVKMNYGKSILML